MSCICVNWNIAIGFANYSFKSPKKKTPSFLYPQLKDRLERLIVGGHYPFAKIEQKSYAIADPDAKQGDQNSEKEVGTWIRANFANVSVSICVGVSVCVRVRVRVCVRVRVRVRVVCTCKCTCRCKCTCTFTCTCTCTCTCTFSVITFSSGSSIFELARLCHIFTKVVGTGNSRGSR